MDKLMGLNDVFKIQGKTRKCVSLNELFLKSIDKSNCEEAIRLSVKEEQQSFVASNLYSIAEFQFLDNFCIKGIYLNETMIGFTMFGVDTDDGNYWIYRLMIDQEFQGKGMGLRAVELFIEEIRRGNEANIPLIMIGYDPENFAARWVYKKAGFVEVGLVPWGERLARYVL